MTRSLEVRTQRADISIREADPSAVALGAGPPKLVGYAATFNSPSQDLGGYVEVLAPGCFARSIAADDARAFFNHNYDFLLGRSKSGTLRLAEDRTGLAFEIDVPDTSLGRDLHALVKRGDLDGVSFGFITIRDEWSEDGKVNTILEAELIEISPVVFPAYLNGPKVEARSSDRLARRPTPALKPAVMSPARVRSILALDRD